MFQIFYQHVALAWDGIHRIKSRLKVILQNCISINEIGLICHYINTKKLRQIRAPKSRILFRAKLWIYKSAPLDVSVILWKMETKGFAHNLNSHDWELRNLLHHHCTPPSSAISLYLFYFVFVCVCVFVFSLCYELCEQMDCICCFLWFVHLWQTFNELQRLLSKTNGKVVGDLMTPAPLVVHENANLEDAARYSIHLLFNYFFTNCLFINGPVYFLIQKSK